MTSRIFWCILFVTCLFVGCGDPAAEDAREMEESSIKPLAILYGQFTAQNRGKPPANEEEFRAFIESSGQQVMQSLNINSIDMLFVSPRDSQPYGVVYGDASGPPGPAGAPVIAYEKVGVEGKRWVASNLGAVELVDEARFRELVPDAG